MLANTSSSAARCATRAAAAAPVRVALVRPAAVSRRAANVTVATAKTAAPVKIIIQGRRLPVTPAIREYVEEKIGRAAHHFASGVKHIDVTISARGGDTGTHGAKQQKVDVTLHTLRHGVVRVEDSEASLYASIDVVADKISRKLRRIKELAVSRGRHRADAVEEADFKEWAATVQVETKAFDEERARDAELAHLSSSARGVAGAGAPASVQRAKKLRVDRMPLDDAVDALEAVGHDFFLFRDEAKGDVRLLYKRREGGYGLLIPDESE